LPGTFEEIKVLSLGIKIEYTVLFITTRNGGMRMKILLNRIAVILFVAICITGFAGCQPDTDGTTPEDPINQGEENEGEAEEETPATGNPKLKELAILYEGNKLQISGDANEELLEALFGVPEEKKTHTYTAEDNMDPHIEKRPMNTDIP